MASTDTRTPRPIQPLTVDGQTMAQWVPEHWTTLGLDTLTPRPDTHTNR